MKQLLANTPLRVKNDFFMNGNTFQTQVTGSVSCKLLAMYQDNCIRVLKTQFQCFNAKYQLCLLFL